MKLGAVVQQPVEELDYDFDYSTWFGETGDSIDSVAATATPTGLTLVPLKSSDTVAKVWVSGGVANTTYYLEVTVTTVGGRIKQDELEIIIQEFV
jgi:hypothetical protein